MTAPSTPVTGQLWEDSNGHTHAWNGTAWVLLPTMETYTERRLHYSYGVNHGTTTGAYFSFEELQRQIESQTMGPVQVDKREERTVVLLPWQEVTR